MLRPATFVLMASTSLAAADAPGVGQRWWGYVKYLADDKLEGRLTGSEGHRKAAQFVADEFQRAGLKPAALSGYIQPVQLHSRVIQEDRSSLSLIREGKPEPLRLGEDATIGLRIRPAESIDAPLVFVGYGLTIPEFKYDDLAGLDLRDKVVVYLSGGPSQVPGALRSHYASVGERWKVLRKAGAVGTVAIQNPRHMDIPWERIALSRFQPAMSLADPSLDEAKDQKLAALLNPAKAEGLFAGSGHPFKELLRLADQGKQLPRFALPASLRAEVRFEEKEIMSQNVVAVLPGADPVLKGEYVVVSAHLDHLGVGEPINGDRIYNGAMDNASGVATLLDVANMLRESGRRPRRSVLFLAVTAEEKGLLGSRYFANYPTVSAKAIVADVNVDMFLPIFPLKILTALGMNDSDLGPMLVSVAESEGLQVQGDLEPERNLFIRSDQYSFIQRGVPSIYFKVGFKPGSPEAAVVKKWLTERYHAPSDDSEQPVDLAAAAEYDKVVMLLAASISDRALRPKWNRDSFFRRFEK